MEPRGRYADTLILLPGAILYEVLALPKSINIYETTGPGKDVQNKQVFL